MNLKQFLKRTAAAVCAAALVIGTSAASTLPVSADSSSSYTKGSNTCSITINTTEKGHQYEAYQIFTGDVYVETTGTGESAVTKKTLSNIEWGSGFDQTKIGDLVSALKNDKTLVPDDATSETNSIKALSDSETSAAVIADAITGVTGDTFDSAYAKAVAQAFGKFLSTTTTGTFSSVKDTTGGAAEDAITGYKVSNIAPGYYLVKDKSGSRGQTTTDGSTTGTETDGSYTRYLLQVVGDAEANPKDGAASVTKKVWNDLLSDREDKWNDTAFFGANDFDNSLADQKFGVDINVYFKLTATLPNNFEDYAEFKELTFVDTLPTGFEMLTDEEAGELDLSGWPFKVLLCDDDNDLTVLPDIESDDKSSNLGNFKVPAGFYDVTDNFITSYDSSTNVFTISYNKELNTLSGGMRGGLSYTYYQAPTSNSKSGPRKAMQQNPSQGGEETKYVTPENGDKIIVIYMATPKDSGGFTVGTEGNDNKVKLQYSNNPNVNYGGEYGTTPEDIVTVFTFRIEPEKYDGVAKNGTKVETTDTVYTTLLAQTGTSYTANDGTLYLKNGNDWYKAAPLAGASFDLYKVEGGTYFLAGTAVSDNNGHVRFYHAEWDENTSQLKGPDTSEGSIEITLMPGTYVIRETKTPDGYNTMSDIKVVLSATGDITADDPKLTSVSVQTYTATANGATTETATTVEENEQQTTTYTYTYGPSTFSNTADTVSVFKITSSSISGDDSHITTNGIATGNIVNEAGVLLPSTGGIGTTIFYVIGGAIAAGALVLLVVRRKKQG